MRWLLLADVHANLAALEAVLADGSSDAHGVLVGGDLIGYGPDPEACVARLRALDAIAVAGNHERMLTGAVPWRCGAAARRALAWTATALGPAEQAWLAALPIWQRIGPSLLLCHGSPADPDRYVDRPDRVAAALAEMAAVAPGASLLACGHTHRACWATATELHPIQRWPLTVFLPEDEPVLINPGAVGQSRDRHLFARYAILDSEGRWVEFRAVPYDVRSTVRRMRAAGLRSPLRARSLLRRVLAEARSREGRCASV